MTEGQYTPSPATAPIEPPTTPLHVAPEHAPAQPQAAPLHTASFAAAGEQCPQCGAHMAVDQRYCLQCGQRRGDPRLPFMDAVVFMDAVKQPQHAAAAPPPPPREQRSRMSANASLIAGVATLVLAIGVGVLIGRSGEGSASTANNTPQVIKVEGGAGGGLETATGNTETGGKAEKGGGESTVGGGAGGKKKQAKSLQEAEHEQAATEVLQTNPNAKPLPPPTVQKGGKCEPGQAGCSKSGKFEGTFFE